MMEHNNNKTKICLLDLNYTLVSNQMESRNVRLFSHRMQAEEYRMDLIHAIEKDYIILVTARPQYQMQETIQNIMKKTGWTPNEMYFNHINEMPPQFKEYALKQFIFPKHGNHAEQYYAIESNPKTRTMYSKYGIKAEPYEKFIKIINQAEQMSLFD